MHCHCSTEGSPCLEVCFGHSSLFLPELMIPGKWPEHAGYQITWSRGVPAFLRLAQVQII